MRVILNQLKGGREAFYDPARRYLILVNDLAEYSLWPDALAVPPGWQALRTGLGRQPAMAAVDRCTQIPRITTAIATPAVDAAEEIARRAAERPDATSTQWSSPPRLLTAGVRAWFGPCGTTHPAESPIAWSPDQ
ncbi:hypothetical protein T261_1512 [Streptomyces lydicus]|nr:hypothetical protein T261_1512 [Streptomyces lydicus]